MQILGISLENINSLVGRWTIDLTDRHFTDDGIFAITGPTGAGKSTILDALTLALYGRTPRLGKIAGDENELMSRGCDHCGASVTFRTPLGAFRASWSQHRSKKSASKKFQSAKREIARLSEASVSGPSTEGKDVILADSITTAEQVIVDITGMEFEQFTRSVLLAQGRFAEFLQTDTKNRSMLLEKITGTEIYSDISARVFRRASEEKKKLDDLKNRIDALEHRTPQDRVSATSERDKLWNRRKEIGKTLEAFERTTRLLRECANDISRGEQERLNILAAIQAENRRMRELNAEREILEKYRSDNIRDGDLIAQLAAIRKEYENFRDLMGRARKANAAWEKADRERIDAQSDLEKKRSESRKAAACIEEIRQQSTRYETTLDLLLKGHAVNDYREEIEKLLRDKDELKTRLRIDALREQRERQHPKIERTEREIRQLEQRRSDQSDLLAALRQLRDEILERRSLEEHRRHLYDGKPCPLCGSIEHPFAGRPSESLDTAEQKYRAVQHELDKITTELHRANGEYGKVRQELVAIDEEMNRLETVIPEISAHEDSTGVSVTIPEKLEEIAFRLDEINLLLGKANQLEIAIKESYKERDRAQEIQSRAAATVHAAEHRLETAVKERERFREECLQREKEAATLETMLHATLFPYLAGNKKEETEINDIEKIFPLLEEKRMIWQKTQERIQENDKQKAVIEKSRAEKENRLEIIDREIATVKTNETRFREEWETWQAARREKFPGPAGSDDDRLQYLKEEEAVLLGRLGVLDDMLLRAKEQEEQQAVMAETIARQTEECAHWDRLNHLLGSADGQKYRNFVQNLTFDSLVDRANAELKKLTDRYRLCRVAGEELRLRVIDDYQGGEVRSTENLSGGESFQISLALALGLSDLAARNVPVDSLFLDEGFGTLDEETLEAALRMLVELRRQGKMIGVISHVPALKERIATRIEVVPRSAGRSELHLSWKRYSDKDLS